MCECTLKRRVQHLCCVSFLRGILPTFVNLSSSSSVNSTQKRRSQQCNVNRHRFVAVAITRKDGRLRILEFAETCGRLLPTKFDFFHYTRTAAEASLGGQSGCPALRLGGQSVKSVIRPPFGRRSRGFLRSFCVQASRLSFASRDCSCSRGHRAPLRRPPRPCSSRSVAR